MCIVDPLPLHKFILELCGVKINVFLAIVQVKQEEKQQYDKFWKANYYVAGSYDKRKDFEYLNEELCGREIQGKSNRIFYLALPPSVFEHVTRNISHTCSASR